MSSLEFSLALLAAIAIMAVGAYNAWVARRRRLTESRTAKGSLDSRGEPSIASGSYSQDDDELTPESYTLDEAGQRPQPGLSEVGDCIVELAFVSPQPGDRLLLLTRSLRRVGNKPVCVEGRLLRSQSLGEGSVDADPMPMNSVPSEPGDVLWSPLVGRGSYDGVRVGVLLANRGGALNSMEFSEFIGAVQALAEQLSVLADTPDMTSVLTRARELDEICANLDAQVGIGIDCPEPLGVADLARLAENCECVERGNNRHARLGPLGEVIFSLALADVPNRLQLLLDVPRVSSALRPWQQMTDCAMRCAQQLGGSLVDDAGKPLSEVQLARIGEQLQMRYASLREAGFPAGSPLALRLFN